MQLLNRLKEAREEQLFDNNPGLLLWFLYTGGAFTPAGETRSEYVSFVNQTYAIHYGAKPGMAEINEVLKLYIWSKEAFSVKIEAFWNETGY